LGPVCRHFLPSSKGRAEVAVQEAHHTAMHLAPVLFDDLVWSSQAAKALASVIELHLCITIIIIITITTIMIIVIMIIAITIMIIKARS